MRHGTWIGLAVAAVLAACGGDVTTGTGGAGGTGGTGGAAGAPPVVEADCAGPSDCQLVDDCCTCMGLPADLVPPNCPDPCVQSSCSALGFTGLDAQCAVGRCVAGFPCNPASVVCNGLPPDCPAGQTPSVVGGCWGECVPSTECASVGGCEQCDPSTQVCVVDEGPIALIFHCVERPDVCETGSLCACMGQSVCGGTYDVCLEQSGTLTCTCPQCA